MTVSLHAVAKGKGAQPGLQPHLRLPPRTAVHLCPELSPQAQRGGRRSPRTPEPADLTAAPCLYTGQPAP